MSSEQIASSSAQSLPDRSVSLTLWYWGPVAAYAALIFYGSSLSATPETVASLVKEVSDKVLHFCEYSVLGALAYRACRNAAGPKVAHSALSYAIVGCAFYGLSDETHQLFVPFREADVVDLMADVAGASGGGWVWSLLGRERI